MAYAYMAREQKNAYLYARQQVIDNMSDWQFILDIICKGNIILARKRYEAFEKQKARIRSDPRWKDRS